MSGSVPVSGGNGGKRLAIVIVHYKTPELLRECLATVMPEMDPERDRVVVVDNASGAEHVAALRGFVKESGVELIESGKNLGFAGANNVGIERVMKGLGGAEFVMLLNPDTLVRAGAVAALLGFLREHKEVGLVGPRLEYPDGSAQVSAFREPRPLSELVRGASIGPVSRMLKRWDVWRPVEESAHETAWLSGACVVMRREVVEKVGLLDAKFFMYYEEVDFFRRAHKMGFRAWYVPAARVVHLVGQASGVGGKNQEMKRLPGYWFESRHRYFRKHFGYVGMVAADGFWMAGRMMNGVRKVLGGGSKAIAAKGEVGDMVRHGMRAMVGAE